MEVGDIDSNVDDCILLIDDKNKEKRILFALFDENSVPQEIYAVDSDETIIEEMNSYAKEIQDYQDYYDGDYSDDEDIDEREEKEYINDDGSYIQNEIGSIDDDYNIHDNPYYNDALDLDQQSPDFWENL